MGWGGEGTYSYVRVYSPPKQLISKEIDSTEHEDNYEYVPPLLQLLLLGAIHCIRGFIWGRRKAKLARPCDKTTPKFSRALVNTKKQDACTGVHSACRREESGRNLDIWVLRLRQGQMQIFLGLKVGEGLDLQIWDLNRAHETELFFQYHRFSACVEADYDMQ